MTWIRNLKTRIAEIGVVAASALTLAGTIGSFAARDINIFSVLVVTQAAVAAALLVPAALEVVRQDRPLSLLYSSGGAADPAH